MCSVEGCQCEDVVQVDVYEGLVGLFGVYQYYCKVYVEQQGEDGLEFISYEVGDELVCQLVQVGGVVWQVLVYGVDGLVELFDIYQEDVEQCEVVDDIECYDVLVVGDGCECCGFWWCGSWVCGCLSCIYVEVF